MNLGETTKQEILASLCLMGDGPEGQKLFAFASQAEESGLQKIAKPLCLGDKVDRKGLKKQIQGIGRPARFSAFQEVHPGWILEKLSDESPRLLALLPQFLPPDSLKVLIAHRPSLAKASSGPVPSEIIEIVREMIENKFLSNPSSLPPPHSGESFSFDHIVWMRSEDLRTLFRDLGLEEIRKAFTGVDASALRAFLARFSPAVASEIRERIERGESVSAEIRKELQMNLVALPLEHLTSEELLREIGYSVFAGVLSSKQALWGETVCRKLPPEEGHRLKKMIHNLKDSLGAKRLRTRKDEIVDRIFRLGSQGHICRYWKKERDFL